MSSLNTQFRQRLVKRVDEELTNQINALLLGHLEHPEYKRACGSIKALQDVKAWCDEIESEINEGK